MVYAPTFTLSIPDCAIGASSSAIRDGTNRRGGPAALRTIGAALVNESTACQVEILRAAWRSWFHANTTVGLGAPQRGEVRLVSACSGGIAVPAIKRDSTSASLPSQVEVRRWCSGITTTGVARRFSWSLALTPALSGSLSTTRTMTVPIIGRGERSGVLSTLSVEPFVLREGEGLAIYTPHNSGDGVSLTSMASGPWILSIAVRVVSTGAIYDFDVPEVVAGHENCAACVFNASGSGVVLEVIQVVATQATSLLNGFPGNPPMVALFHTRKGAGSASDPEGLRRDLSATIVPHDSAIGLNSSIKAYAGVLPHNPIVHGDQTTMAVWPAIGSLGWESANDASSLGRIRRITPPMMANGAALGPLHINGMGGNGDIVRSLSHASARPFTLQPGEALSVGQAFPAPGLHGGETTIGVAAPAVYVGDFDVVFRVLPVRGKPEVRSA